MRKEVDYRVPAQQPCFQFNFTLSEPQFNWVSDDCMSGSRLDKGWGHSCPRRKFSPYCPLFHRLWHSNIGTIWGSWAWWFWLNGDSINKENKLLFAITIYEHCHSSLYLKVSPEEHFYLNKYNLPCFQQSWNRVRSGGGWSTWYRPGLFSFFWIWQSNFSANWPPVLFSLTISPVTVVLLGVGIKLCFSGGCPIIRYAHNSDLDECQVWRLPRVQIWFQHLTIDQCKVWCMLKRGYTTSPVTGGPSVARFHVNGGHPQPHTPRFSDIERV